MKNLTERLSLKLWLCFISLSWKLIRLLCPRRSERTSKPIFSKEAKDAPGVVFFAHNVVFPDGSESLPGCQPMKNCAVATSTSQLLTTLFPQNREKYSLVDIGCLEGGYTAAYAELGFNALGLEVRESNFVASEYVRERMKLPNLRFVKDDAWNLEKHGPFDITFCAGLLYHLDNPRRYLDILGRMTNRVLVLHTQYAPESFLRAQRFHLSPMVTHENLRGRWFAEFPEHTSADTQESLRLASWNNAQSFWLTRESILQGMKEAGFDMVFEQYDYLGDGIAESIRKGFYAKSSRGIFIGVKS